MVCKTRRVAGVVPVRSPDASPPQMPGTDADPMFTELLCDGLEIPCYFLIGLVLLQEQFLEDSARHMPTCHRGLHTLSDMKPTLICGRLRTQAEYRPGPRVVHFRSA
jgi:hypothetical protein